MKIIYHHRTRAQGAEGVHIREMVNAFKELHHEVFVVSPPGVNILLDVKRNFKAVESSGLIAKLWECVSKNLPEIFFELLELGYNVIAFTNLCKVFKKEHIDFIYERNAFFCFASVYFANRNKIPIILEVNEISGIKRNRGQFFKSLAKLIEINNFKRADAIIVVSNYLKTEIEREGIMSSKVFVIPNAVNHNDFDPNIICSNDKISGFSHSVINIGFVGTFSWWDNLELLVDAFREINLENKDVRLILIGDGYKKNELEIYVRKLGLESFVIFIGRVPRHDVPQYIADLDICIIPDSNNFGSPIVLFEYMAMEKPVVAPRLSTIDKVIQDNINGKLFTAGDRSELRDAINLLINNADLRLNLGKEARRSILGQYLWINNASAVMDIIYKL